MKTKLIKFAFAGAIAIVAGINVFKAQKDVELSDIAKENVEALADNEYEDREDCDPNGIECPLLVIYPDGDWGEDIRYGEKKKPGWL